MESIIAIITHPITTHAAAAIVGACLGLLVMAMLAMGKLGDDPLPEPQAPGYVDQDVETVQSIHDLRELRRLRSRTLVKGYQIVSDGGDYDPDAWKHASVKAPHADASAATFHRAGDA